MSKKRLATMVGGTVLTALAIGFFMQRGETAAPRNLVPALPVAIQQVVLKPADPAAPPTQMADEVANLSQTQTPVLASAVAPAMIPPALPDPRPGSGPLAANLADDTAPASDPAMLGPECDVTATATPGPMAMVDLALSAPCLANERVTIHHNGLMFTQVTDDAGNLSITVPALGQRAVFVFAFGDGRGTVALANVANLTQFDRVVVQWTGDAGFEIHALEFGAAYGGPGHVWSGAVAVAGPQKSTGFVTRLGDPTTLAPQMAEIYTFPSGFSSQSGVVALSVEAEVTADNCGRDISAQSLELRGRSGLRTRELVMAMPDCSGLGDFLVLNNLLDDLKIAAR